MTTPCTTHIEDIAHLKRKLATAEARLKQAQSFVYELRCAAARKEERGLWIREKDKSGLGSALWDEKADLGALSWIKREDVPKPATLSSAARDLYSELGAAPSSSSSRTFSKRFPPELFYHLVEHTFMSTNYTLCLVSPAFRSIASPLLYESMTIVHPGQLEPFLPNPRDPSAVIDRSLTLDRVLSLDITVKSGIPDRRDTVEMMTYKHVPLPNLSILNLHLDENDNYELWPGEAHRRTPLTRIDHLAFAATFMSHLNPLSLTISRETRDDPFWKPVLLQRTLWTQATSGWTRLEYVAFVDCSWLYLQDEDHDADIFGGIAIFSSSDLPGCRPSLMAFSWALTSRLGGYSSCWKGRRHNYMLSIAGPELYAWGPGVGVRTVNLEIVVTEEDRKALMEDLEILPSEWKGLVHY